ncbi:MAG: hypothetical protein OXN83_04075, partial [Oligoflexia bacterium]|nr:hypothetical protein [Oligoflexia bacterium]
MNKELKIKFIKKQLIGSFSLFLALYSTVAQAQFSECLKEELSNEIHFSQAVFFDITSDTNIESLSNIYTQLREVTDNKLIKNLEARRLINQEDWEKIPQRFKDNAWRAYGDKTINAWFKGREYVLSLPKEQTLNSDLLKKIHKIVTEHHKFHGFEGRRLLQRLRNGEISRQEFSALKKRAFEDNEEIAGTPHSSL